MTANPLSAIPPMTAPPGMQQRSTARFTPLDPLRVLRQYAVWIIVAGLVGLMIGLGTFFYLRKYKPRYSSTARLAVTMPVKAWSDGDPDNFRIDERSTSTFIRNQTVFLGSDEILSAAIQREDIRRTSWFQSFLDPRDAVRDLQKNLGAGQVPGSTFFSVSMTITGEQQSKDLPVVLNGVIQTYLAQYRLNADMTQSGVRRLFQRERDRMDEEMRAIEQEQIRFSRENDLTMLEPRSGEITGMYYELTRQETNVRLAMLQVKERYETLMQERTAGKFTYTPEEMAAAEAKPDVDSRKARVTNLKDTIALMEYRFGPNHREVVAAKRALVEAEKAYNRALETSLLELQETRIAGLAERRGQLEAQLESLVKQIEETRLEMQDLASKMQQFAAIGSRRQILRERMIDVENKLNDIRVLTQRPDAERVRLMLDPTAPVLVYPRFGGVVFASTSLALAAVLGLAFVREMLDQRIKSPADLRLLPDTESLGVIPASSEDPSSPASIDNVVKDDPNGLMAESFRQTRTSLLTRMDRRGYKTLMVVGAQREVGTSTIARNLALSLAFNGRKVILLDANFRRPRQHAFAGHDSAEPGLVEVLTNKAMLAQVVRVGENPAIDVLPNGRGSDAPPELLEGAAFRNLLSQLESEYDLIIIDAPPALVTSEAQLLSKRVDAIAIVVRAMNEKRGMISRMIRQLDGHRADILGVVLNGVRGSAGGYFRKSYRDYYQYRSTGHSNGNGNGSNGHAKASKRKGKKAAAQAQA